jgi:hypothetical protein
MLDLQVEHAHHVTVSGYMRESVLCVHVSLTDVSSARSLSRSSRLSPEASHVEFAPAQSVSGNLRGHSKSHVLL